MHQPVVTKGIVLARTDYGEADRIITFITPDHGKLKAIAKGVRRAKSKLAGGIELFSVSDLTYIVGRGEIQTLISTRLESHFGNIVKDLHRTTKAYEILKFINKATEEAAEAGYYNLLKHALESLNNPEIDTDIIALWFNLQLLKLMGHAPDLHTDINGQKLSPGTDYNFYFDEMKFGKSPDGSGLAPKFIKFLRLGLQARAPQVLGRVEGAEELAVKTQPLAASMLKSYVQVH